MKIPLLTITLSFFLTACATQKFVARNADFILERQVAKRIPLTTEQRTVLERDIKRFLNSEKEQLKKAIPLIQKIQNDPEQMSFLYQDFSNIYKAIAHDFSKMVCDHLIELDKNQQKEFFSILAKENSEISRKESKVNLELIEARFEDLAGEISKEQKSIINSYSSYFEERQKVRLENRKRLATRLEEIYALELSKKEKEKFFIAAFTEYQEKTFSGIKHDEIIVKILPTLTTNQKKEIKQKAQDLKSILNYYLETDY
jgi:hypothetical protein